MSSCCLLQCHQQLRTCSEEPCAMKLGVAWSPCMSGCWVGPRFKTAAEAAHQ